ncbi:ATP-binding protein [Spirillospora sp. NPDC048911]|uniref:ATP-binding protein n=1 Tax=Spirillospora sp. NPDC048911 TaxID=3364527 RepID=UPI003722D316
MDHDELSRLPSQSELADMAEGTVPGAGIDAALRAGSADAGLTVVEDSGGGWRLALDAEQLWLLSKAADLAGMSVAGYVRRAVIERAERDRIAMEASWAASAAGGARAGVPAGMARLGRWWLSGTAAAAQARKLVRWAWSDWGLDGLADDGVVMASELVANAVLHGGGTSVVLCLGRAADGGEGVCGVADGSPVGPRPARAAVDEEGKRGLALVAALSHSCGWYRLSPGKMVWFSQRPARMAGQSLAVAKRATAGAAAAVFPAGCGSPHPVLGDMLGDWCARGGIR